MYYELNRLLLIAGRQDIPKEPAMRSNQHAAANGTRANAGPLPALG